MKSETVEERKNKKEVIVKLAFGLLIAIAFISAFNIFQMYGVDNADGLTSISGRAVQASVSSGIDVIPKGIPEIYGAELTVNFNDVSSANPQKADATINRLGTLDREITLADEELERYISIVSRISCEYCCGAESIIFPNGQAACGCAHSFAMRGLAKYLIKYHGSEYSDDEVLEELGKWKTLFFPAKMSEKASILQERGIELSYINLASNKYRGIEQEAGASGGMVGGC